MLRDFVVVVVGAHGPAIHAHSHVDHEKRDAWFLFLCMHVVPFSRAMVLRWVALHAAGAPLLLLLPVHIRSALRSHESRKGA